MADPGFDEILEVIGRRMADSGFDEILDFTTGIKSMEYCLGSITLEELYHINSFLKQYTGSTEILLSAGSKTRAVNPLRSKRYSVI